VNASVEATVGQRYGLLTILALLIGLVVYPLLYSTDFFGGILFSTFPGLLPKLLDQTSRAEWWYFGVSNLLFHWVPFAFIAVALWRNREPWLSIGVDWAWFIRHKAWFLALVGLLIVAALAMPRMFYGSELPARSFART
jgi:hypothetical protein